MAFKLSLAVVPLRTNESPTCKFRSLARLVEMTTPRLPWVR
ncbi:hypothetical protein [Psychrilyobacter sp.]